MCLEQLVSNNSLFFTGLLGILYNRNSILVVLMGIEMALLGINLNFISFSIAIAKAFMKTTFSIFQKNDLNFFHARLVFIDNFHQ